MASTGVSWASSGSSHELTAAARCVGNFVNHSSESTQHDTHPPASFCPLSSSEYFWLFFPLHAFTTTYGRFVLPACYLHRSTPVFASISASLSQTLSEFLKCPNTGVHPTVSTQNDPERDPKGTSVQAQPMCNRLTFREKNLATGSGSDQQLEGESNNSKCRVTNE